MDPFLHRGGSESGFGPFYSPVYPSTYFQWSWEFFICILTTASVFFGVANIFEIICNTKEDWCRGYHQSNIHVSTCLWIKIGLSHLPGSSATRGLAKVLAAASVFFGFANGFNGMRIRQCSTVLIRATHLCMRGSQVPVHNISIRYPHQWEDGAGLLVSSFEC